MMIGVRAYKKANVTTADPLRIVVMLYDGFLKFGQAALEAMRRENPAEVGAHLGRALPILQELQASLNHEAAPELSGNLDSLYQFVHDTLLTARLRRDPESFEQALCIIAELRDGWTSLSATGVGSGA